MGVQKGTSLLSFIIVFAAVAAFVVGFIYIKKTYSQNKVSQAEVSWKGTAFEWSERVVNDAAFVSSLENKYIELEGILLNVVVSQGATTLYFTSGFQRDSAYLVGQQTEWQAIDTQATRSSCDTLIIMYGRNYNLQPAAVAVNFFGDVVNDEDDPLLNFSFFEACRYTRGKRDEYRLHNFCANQITVRAKLRTVAKEEKGLTVELDEVLILSNKKNKIKIQ